MTVMCYRNPPSQRRCSVAFQFVRTRSSPRTAPHVHHAYETSVVINGEEDTVRVRLAPVAQHTNGVVWVDALRRDWAALRMVVE
jgi:hypothetical protein